MDQGKITEYASRPTIKAEAVSDSGYLGGGLGATTVRAAAEEALQKCKLYVDQFKAHDEETCALFMIGDQKVGTWSEH